MIRKALKGLGTDERKLVDIVATRTNAQRQAVAQAYQCNYKRDMLADIKVSSKNVLTDGFPPPEPLPFISCPFPPALLSSRCFSLLSFLNLSIFLLVLLSR